MLKGTVTQWWLRALARVYYVILGKAYMYNSYSAFLCLEQYELPRTTGELLEVSRVVKHND